ncbi:hypothetical protein B296_00034736 [Ensete ventricosum]|uniref:Uncharacterized protein n=1 Tax=Ensete ventricosum TaxID=4639 RepID=A0A426YUT8_ENSVE|nr:hypothetical protein B296_00034736 [Ensete ventricosum]
MCPADYCSPAAADGTPTPETAPEEDGSTMPAPRDLAIAIRLLERVKISTPARIVLDNCCNRTKRRDAPHPARAGYRSLTRGQHP